MDRSSWIVRIILNELGDPLSGRDVLCLDGKYRKCRTIFVSGDTPREDIQKQHSGPDVYMVDCIGPFSNTSGS